ncbi:preprotein translocase subunit YajC [Desulfitispora alkaliphila]|uniref:preprotein translocase subunit YajC n=1 Tax=Desulfitispora alkaliphila TaxID=622674 RepID=UPI003D1F0734
MEGITGALLYLLVFFAILYFLLIRPQQKQQKQRKEMLESLNVNTKVITVGGLYGTIKKIDDETVVLKVADNVELKFTRQAVGQIVED